MLKLDNYINFNVLVIETDNQTNQGKLIEVNSTTITILNKDNIKQTLPITYVDNMFILE